jgi:hypothetical protein
MWALPALVIAPWCRGHKAGEGHVGSRRGETAEVAGLGEDGDRRQGVDATEGAQAGGVCRQRLGCGSLLDLCIDSVKLRVSDRVGAHQVVEGGLGGGLGEAQRPQPDLEAEAPAGTGGRVTLAVAQQEAADPLAGDAAVAL